MPFRDVIGHHHLVRLLVRAASRVTLPPSLIFAGPDGVGKATVAVALAQFLNCEETASPAPDTAPDAFDACGACRSCTMLARAARAFRGGEPQAVDCLQWLQPDDRASIKIERVREVLSRAGYRPFDGRVRVVVIDQAETLEVASQQALLKMLEEPPPATRFLLVTAQPDALLPTIRSRCPVLRFAPLPSADLVQALVERFGWHRDRALVATATADGRLGRALDQGDPERFEAREVAATVLEQVLGSRGPVERLEAAQALVGRFERGAGRGEGGRSRRDAPSRQDISARLEALAALLRDIGVLSTRADQQRLANADLAPRLSGLASALRGDRLVRAFSTVARAQTALERNASQKVVADWLVLNL
jgi:DNA polymerase-3 subunit delta'